MAMQIILPGGKAIRRHVRWDSNDGLRGLITLNGHDARVYRESQAHNWRLVEEGGPTQPLAASADGASQAAEQVVESIEDDDDKWKRWAAEELASF